MTRNEWDMGLGVYGLAVISGSRCVIRSWFVVVWHLVIAFLVVCVDLCAMLKHHRRLHSFILLLSVQLGMMVLDLLIGI